MECPVCGVAFTRIHSAGKPPKNCSRACANKVPGRMTTEVRQKIGTAIRAEGHPNWAGGSWVGDFGTVYIRVPDDERGRHPTMRPDGYIRRYHYVWNRANPNDPVQPGDVIHHRNENHQDDRVENLEKTHQSKHAREHGTGRKHRSESLELMREKQIARRSQERGNRPGSWAAEMCGTSRGYFRHRSVGEPACRPCLDAHAAKTKEAKARR